MLQIPGRIPAALSLILPVPVQAQGQQCCHGLNRNIVAELHLQCVTHQPPALQQTHLAHNLLCPALAMKDPEYVPQVLHGKLLKLGSVLVECLVDVVLVCTVDLQPGVVDHLQTFVH